MNKGIRTTLLVIIAIFFCVLIFMRNEVSQAQEEVSGPEVSAKIDQVLTIQKQILQELGAIKQQLDAMQVSTNKL